ncbi:hypothetical protein RUND412_007835 [Rhizina undulata]
MNSYTAMVSSSISGIPKVKQTRRVIKYSLAPKFSVWRRDPISYNEENLREFAAASAALEQTATVTVADPPEALPPPSSAAVNVVEAVPVIAPGNLNHGPLPNRPPPQGTTDTLPGKLVAPEPTTTTPAQEQYGGSRANPPPVPSEE